MRSGLQHFGWHRGLRARDYDRAFQILEDWEPLFEDFRIRPTSAPAPSQSPWTITHGVGQAHVAIEQEELDEEVPQEELDEEVPEEELDEELAVTETEPEELAEELAVEEQVEVFLVPEEEDIVVIEDEGEEIACLLYTSPSPRD